MARQPRRGQLFSTAGGATLIVRSIILESPLRIDLHTHSTASDGTTTPADLARAAAAAGLDVVALTDHDTTAGIEAAAAALPPGLTLIPGAEISCRAPAADGTTISLHLLAYLFDPTEPAFRAARERLRGSRVRRAERIVARLRADGHPVSWERVREIAGGTVGRPHIAAALLEVGRIPDISTAFTSAWLRRGSPYYVGKEELDVYAAIRLVAAAGGVSVFAHPLAVQRGRVVGDDVIVAMAAAGLGGLEIDHPDHDQPAKAHLRGLAAELSLLTSGSSDFHGTYKTVPLGAERTDPAAYEEIVARASGARPVVG